jgi:DNA repair photolyase
MVEVVRQQRKPPILTPSTIPCLHRHPTINVTRGCSLGCTYCYIQGYSQFPGFGRVVLYDNTPTLLQEELRRRSRPPPRVFFSPSSDVFQDLPEVQDFSLRTMKILLDAGVEIAFLTKGFITPAFMELFRARPQAVHAQVGITTLDEPLCAALEPRAAPPQQRLDYVRQLAAIGVAVTARLDPLVPDVTDSEENLVPLLDSLQQAGTTRLSASYLFLRPSFARQVTRQIESFRLGPCAPPKWQRTGFLSDFGSGWMMAAGERANRFRHLQSLANAYGIRLVVCRCKNPEFAGPGCGISGLPATAEAAASSPQREFEFVEQVREASGVPRSATAID